MVPVYQLLYQEVNDLLMVLFISDRRGKGDHVANQNEVADVLSNKLYEDLKSLLTPELATIGN